MGNSRRPIILVITIVILLIVGLIVGDIFARKSAQKQAKQAIMSIPSVEPQGLEVKAKGEPFLTQAIKGKLKHVDIKADALYFKVDNADIALQQLVGEAKGLTTAKPYVADSAKGSCIVTTQSLQNIVNAKGLSMKVQTDQGHLYLLATINGVPIKMTLSANPTVTKSSDLTRDIPGIEFKATDLSINIEKFGAKTNAQNPVDKQENDAENKDKGDKKEDKKDSKSKNKDKDKDKDKADSGVLSLSSVFKDFIAPSFVLPLEQAPSGLEITELTLEEDGVHLSLSGTNLNLSAIQEQITALSGGPQGAQAGQAQGARAGQGGAVQGTTQGTTQGNSTQENTVQGGKDQNGTRKGNEQGGTQNSSQNKNDQDKKKDRN